jgi:hypothetical protein
MNLNEWRIFFFSAGFIVILMIVAPLTWGFFSGNEEQFTSMAILGENMTEGKYFPSITANITSGEVMRWNIILYNHMDATQYMLVKVKVLDSHMSAPNDILLVPSPEPAVYEIESIINKQSTTSIPFQWTITNASVSDNQLLINKMAFNGQPTNLSLDLEKGDKLRLVFELWLFDAESSIFKFNGGPPESPRIVWNQIWFDFE